MINLNIEIFTSAAGDMELAKYKFLAALNRTVESLHRSRLYPSFEELIDLVNGLNYLISSKTYLDASARRKIIEYNDFGEPETDTDSVYPQDNITKSLFDFIDWSMPKLNEALNEARAIYDFVNSNMKLEEVGICPLYENEGYFILPDPVKKTINIYRFKFSNIISAEIPLTAVKTILLETKANPKNEMKPERIKLELLEKYRDLPNPATFNVVTELDFPYDETILPVAKHKLVKLIAA